MKNMEIKFSPSELRTVNLAIDTYEEKTMVGRLRNPLWKNEQTFNGTTQLLMMVDQLLNLLEQQEQSQTTADIPCEDDMRGSTYEDDISAPLAQFFVRVLYHQNTSWQGTVYWLESKAEAHFRSVCELLILLDGALSEAVASRKIHE